MSRTFITCACLLTVLNCGCSGAPGPEGSRTTDKRQTTAFADWTTSPEEQAAVRDLVEQLVMTDEPATNQPMRNPGITIFDADGKSVKPVGEAQKAEERRKRFEACEAAFQKLLEFKMASFPLLVEHLDDKRQSINFRNHYLANSVGDACRWNIYFQLVDTPENYSSYGYARTGRDRKDHPKPAWEGTPFDDAGGVREWLEENKSLSYLGMQIKCLQWFLDKEKAIGASDAESYFLNILPLEVRILERRQQAGEDVGSELTKLRRALAEKDASVIPAVLLPTG
jgi:hypothetical protein